MVTASTGRSPSTSFNTVNLLNEWMDPRWIVTRGYTDPSDEERERPRALALLARSAAARPHRAVPERVVFPPIRDRVARRISKAEFDARLDRIAAFERRLPTMAR